MLYMKEMRAKVVAECTLKESAAINQILGRRVSRFYFVKIIISFRLSENCLQAGVSVSNRKREIFCGIDRKCYARLRHGFFAARIVVVRFLFGTLLAVLQSQCFFVVGLLCAFDSGTPV